MANGFMKAALRKARMPRMVRNIPAGRKRYSKWNDGDGNERHPGFPTGLDPQIAGRYAVAIAWCVDRRDWPRAHELVDSAAGEFFRAFPKAKGETSDAWPAEPHHWLTWLPLMAICQVGELSEAEGAKVQLHLERRMWEGAHATIEHAELVFGKPVLEVTLDSSVAELGLDLRTVNGLEEVGVLTVDELLQCRVDGEQLLTRDGRRVPNFGKLVIGRIRKAVESIALKHRPAAA